MALNNNTTIQSILILLAFGILSFLVYDYYVKKTVTDTAEEFEDFEYLDDEEELPPLNNESDEQYMYEEAPQPSASTTESNPRPVPVIESVTKNIPKDCFPKDKLTPEDLLPNDAANSEWAQVNPAGQGELANRNYLTSGHHIGINTVGNTLRNANMQLRSEPPNPRRDTGPWQQSTIEPDLNRRALEINGCD